jgi:hypothetical protein
VSAKAEPSNEELCARIRAYWRRVRGGEACAVEVADGKPYTLANGTRVTPRVIVSNIKAGLPPGVSSLDVRRAGKGL